MDTTAYQAILDATNTDHIIWTNKGHYRVKKLHITFMPILGHIKYDRLAPVNLTKGQIAELSEAIKQQHRRQNITNEKLFTAKIIKALG